jgi:hypothetical protein
LRAAGNDAFPFEALGEMLAAIPASTTNAPKAALPERRLRLAITVEHSTSFPEESARFAALFLDRALRDTGAGSADCNGEIRGADGRPISSNLSVSMRGDARAARSRAAAFLDVCRVLPAVRWSGDPLVLPTEPRRYVQLCNLTLARWTLYGKTGVRFDRPPLDDAQRHAIGATLDGLGFARADRLGIRAQTLPDGCKVEALFPDLLTDENLDGGSLWLDRLTPASAEVVWKLMTAAGLLVAAPLIAPNPKLAEAVDNPWPGTRIASDTATLLTILRGR